MASPPATNQNHGRYSERHLCPPLARCDGPGEVIHRLAWPQKPLRASRQTDVLARFVNCRTGNGPLAYDRRLSPSAHQLQQKLLLFFGFGLGDPTQGLFGTVDVTETDKAYEISAELPGMFRGAGLRPSK